MTPATTMVRRPAGSPRRRGGRTVRGTIGDRHQPGQSRQLAVGPRRRVRQPAARTRTPDHAEQPGADVRPDDGPDLGDEQADRARRSPGPRAASSAARTGSWMCCTANSSRPPRAAPPGSRLEPLDRAARRAHALDRLDLAPQRQDRLDLQGRPEVRLGEPIRPPRRRNSSVSTANHVFRSRPQRRADSPHSVGVAPRRARAAAAIATNPAAAGGLGVDDHHRSASIARSTSARAPAPPPAPSPEIPPERCRETTSSAGLQDRLEDLQEIPDRRLRGGRQVLRRPADARSRRRSPAGRTRGPSRPAN